jgi:hypothetical protein
MKIRLLTDRVAEGDARSAGEEIDVPAAEARRLIESGSAEPVAVTRRDRAEKRQGRSG